MVVVRLRWQTMMCEALEERKKVDKETGRVRHIERDAYVSLSSGNGLLCPPGTDSNRSGLSRNEKTSDYLCMGAVPLSDSALGE